jgi:D-serine deaminase-like pyridoxal phosphate-dependent protein
MSIDELLTPALLLDVDILERNLAKMQKKVTALGSLLRPHIKTHKCIEIARMQRERGAKGITVSTFYEAQEFAKAGFDDITWAFPIPLVYTAPAIELARKITFRVAVDSNEAIVSLEKACKALGTTMHVWLKVDCGYHRAGVDPSSQFAEDLVRMLIKSRDLHFDGILSHSGHAYYGTTHEEILKVANQERDVMLDIAARMRNSGYKIPGISIGSTPAMSVIENLDGITEVRPGNYCFYDKTMIDLGICAPEDCAVSVLASVISHQRNASHFVIDAGALALSKDTGVSPPKGNGAMGILFADIKSLQVRQHPIVKTLSQEHGKIFARDPHEIEGEFVVGSKLRILENHSCLTVAHFDEFHVVRGTEVIDRWKILRGRA